ncbi:MAG: hypothetical protein Q9208_007225 [Pyrenodesmia sp. 3 TL-2023]
MGHHKFTNGTTGSPDLGKMLDLRILRMRAHEVRDKFEGVPYTSRCTAKNVVPYYKYCSPREILAEYYRVVLPGRKEQDYHKREESMSEDPLKPEELERHICRIIGLMFKLRMKQVRADVEGSGPCPTSARVRSEDAPGPMPGNEETRTIKRERLHPTDTGATEAEDTLPQPSISHSATSTMPSQAAEADCAVGTLGASASGTGKLHHGVNDITALHDSWDMIEATEEGYDGFAVEGVLKSLAVEDKDVGQAEEASDWDLCE